MTSREEAWDAQSKHLDKTMDEDAWGRPKYKHPHVQTLFEGFCSGWQASREAIKVRGAAAWITPDAIAVNMPFGVEGEEPLYRIAD